MFISSVADDNRLEAMPIVPSTFSRICPVEDTILRRAV